MELSLLEVFRTHVRPPELSVCLKDRCITSFVFFSDREIRTPKDQKLLVSRFLIVKTLKTIGKSQDGILEQNMAMFGSLLWKVISIIGLKTPGNY